MATAIWRGDQAALFQTVTSTMSGTWATGDTATATINGKSVTVTAVTDFAVADIAEILGRAINGDAIANDETRNTTGNLIGEFTGITATYSGAVLTMTADTSGVPFTVVMSRVTSASGVIGAATTTVSPIGPSEFAAGNVSTGSITPSSDSLAFENSTVSCLYALDQSAEATWDALDIEQGYTGDIGLSRFNSGATPGYAEYLQRYLKINATAVTIGEGSGNGSGRIFLDLSTTLTTVTVRNTGSSSDTDLHALRLKAVNSSNALNVEGGTVDVAPDAGDASTFSTIDISGGTVRCSNGVVCTTYEVTGKGSLDIDSLAALADVTTLTQRDSANVTIRGDNAYTTINVYGGTLKYLGSGTVTNVNVGSKGKIDTSESTVDCIFSNTTVAAGGEINDPASRITFSTPIDLGLSGLEDVRLKLGKGINVLPS